MGQTREMNAFRSPQSVLRDGITIARDIFEMPSMEVFVRWRGIRTINLNRRLCSHLLHTLVFPLMFGSALPATAATNLPSGFEDVTVGTGLSNPAAMEFAPDGRLFVA